MKKERVFWGVFFIAAAIFIIVSKMGYLEGIGIWSLLATIFLAACLIKSIAYRSVTGILFSLAFLCIIYSELLGIEAITPWPVLGAALLGSIGIGFFYHPKRSWGKVYGVYVDDNETVETVEDAQMKFNTSFGGSIKYVNSDDFKSAIMKCSFGSMKVYFDNAVIQSGNAVIQMDVSFAGVELYIPRTWNVVNKIDTAFGGVEEKGRNQSTGVPAVTLVGKVSFGGIEIVYV